MVDQPKNTHENGCASWEQAHKDPVQNAVFLKKSYNYEKSDGERFSVFLFFCVQERRTRDDPKIFTKIMLWKKTKQKAEKRATTDFPEKTKKNGGKAKK